MGAVSVSCAGSATRDAGAQPQPASAANVAVSDHKKRQNRNAATPAIAMAAIHADASVLKTNNVEPEKAPASKGATSGTAQHAAHAARWPVLPTATARPRAISPPNILAKCAAS